MAAIPPQLLRSVSGTGGEGEVSCPRTQRQRFGCQEAGSEPATLRFLARLLYPLRHTAAIRPRMKEGIHRNVGVDSRHCYVKNARRESLDCMEATQVFNKVSHHGEAEQQHATADHGEAEQQHATADHGGAEQQHATADHGEAEQQHATADHGGAEQQHATADHGEAEQQHATADHSGAEQQHATNERETSGKEEAHAAVARLHSSEARTNQAGRGPATGQQRRHHHLTAAGPAAFSRRQVTAAGRRGRGQAGG
ncbi:prespore vesicle protein-like isoform X2 [Entelurus aequoreus]|uniref:prespore vesicle protein-like isoform X2 n=1 Tax=Entelurus aequoreus TaxID=161455 RepID=UPI002B1E2B94|nr:prespore vesicle protein-like isoform X2 [Entelurus aequoreus]